MKDGPVAPGPGGLPWLAAGLALLVGLLAPGLAAWAAPGLFLASALVLGLPHGAADPWVPQWAAGQRWTTLRPWLRFAGFYLVAVGVTLAAWHWTRLASTVGFLLLTAWHWGSADASGTLPPRTRRWAALALGRGLVVVAGSLALRPAAEGWAVLDALAGSAAAGEAIAATAWPLLIVGVLLEAVILSLTALDAVMAGERDPERAWRRLGRQALETLLLLALFRFLPAVASVGVYFVCFHAWRHVERLAALQPGTPAAGGVLRRVGLFYRRVWPFALGALVMVPGFHHLLARPAVEPGGGGWLTAYLILLSALTVPHAAVVFHWLDRRENAGARPAAPVEE